MSNNVPVLMLRGADGKFFPVAGITGGGSGGTGGASTAANVSYTNTQLPNVKNVKTALDELIPNSHSLDNKSVLDKFAETDGKPTYNGEALGGGGGAGDFIIKMTVEGDGDGNYTVISCDATIEQIDAAIAAKKRIVVIASVDDITVFELPILGVEHNIYYFGVFMGGQVITSFARKVGENEAGWQFLITYIEADGISYSNAAMPNISTVKETLDKLVPKSHTHDNKGALDTLSISNGKLLCNGSDVGLKGDKGADGITPHIGANNNWFLGTTDTGKPSRGEKGDKGDPGSDANVTKDNVVAALGYTPESVSTQVTTGSNITLADNTEYRLTDVTTLSLSYPTGKFECWMRLSFAASGNITVTLPNDTEYLGATPDFKNSDTWELSFKDKVLAAKKVGVDDGGAGGENGVTPHIGENGNWYIGNTDTGKPSRGAKGDKGEDGKSAYQYAQDGGYTGTETEFAEKMAQEQLSGTTSELTPTQVYDAVSAGIPVKVQYLNDVYGLLSFTAFNIAESFNMIVSQTIVYYNDAYILAELNGDKSGNRWWTKFTTLAQKTDIPSKLPNPNALTIKIGSTSVTYDGSTAKTVEIADGSEVEY